MSARNNPWFSHSVPGCATLRCCSCRKEIDLKFPSLDHHPSVCPACGVECIFITWKDVTIQIVLEEAAPEFSRILRWAQENLDELEFVTVLDALSQIHDAVAESIESAAHVGKGG